MKKLLISIFLTGVCFAGVEENLISTQEIALHELNHMEGWLDDVGVAKQVAKDRGVPLLIAFLGPNWCAPSDKLEEEVLTSELFVKQLEKDFVLVKVDIKQDFEEVPYKDEYGIDSCPSIILARPTGEKIAKLENLNTSLDLVCTAIKGVLRDYEEVHGLSRGKLKVLKGNELENLYTKAGRLADNALKTSILSQGLKRDKSPYFLLEQYGQLLTHGKYKRSQIQKLRAQILARDPKNALGYQRKLAVLDFDVLAKGVKKKSDIVIAPIVDYLKKFGKEDFEHAWRLEMKLSQYLFSQDQIEAALVHAQNSFAIAPEKKKDAIAQSINYLKGISPGNNVQ